MEKIKTYKASLDTVAKTVTIAVTLLFVVVIIGQFKIIPGNGILLPSAITVFLVLMYCITFALSPVRYSLSENFLFIVRPFDKVRINRVDIDRVELIEKATLSRSVRVFGSGGLFGYFGKFMNTRFGRMTWYATRRDHPVLIVLQNGKKILVTPDDAEGFLSELS